MIQDIPKFYTALAEWMACLCFGLLLKRRWNWAVTGCMMAGSLLLLSVVPYLIGIVPVAFWIPGMIIALAVMYGMIYICCKVPAADIGFYWAIAFMFAEFSASVEWQFYSYFANTFTDSILWQGFFLVIFYGGIFGILYCIEKKRLMDAGDMGISWRELVSAVAISLGAFLISNISYVYSNTPFSGRMSTEIFYIRTLVDLAGVVMLVSLQDRLRDLHIRKELDAIQTLLVRQYDQYRLSRENMDVINRKYHDLKHQIGIIRLEANADKREEYLNQLESGMKSLGMEYDTGSDVLDTILTSKQLYCRQNQITLNVVVDGARLDFLELMDVCSIFGNTLDNAIESVEKLEDIQKRLIRLAVYTQNDFLMIRVENYYENDLQIENGTYKTTKQDKEFHGYGIKSIRYTAEKYGGYVSISTEENWFSLRVLIPLKQ